MTLDELRAGLDLSPAHAVVVDCRSAPRHPGFVRTVTLYEDLRVSVEFDVHGFDEGGVNCWAAYDSLDAVVSALQEYLMQPLAAWPRPSESLPYPSRSPSFANDVQAGSDALQSDLAAQRLDLPLKGAFRTQSHLGPA